MSDRAVAINYQVEEQALNQTVAANPQINSDLPSLTIDTSGWLESVFKQINKLKEALLRWLEVNFKIMEGQPDFKNAMQLVFYAFMAVLTIYVFYHVITLIQKKMRSSNSSERLSTPLGFSENDELQRELQRSIQEQQWARASRLRWRLFLLRKNFPEVMTPNEFFIKTKNSQLPQVDQQYKNMFSKDVAGGDWYRLYNQSLNQLER